MKRRIPINRIEIYYTISILVIILLMLGFFFVVGRSYIIDERTENLQETTERAMTDIEVVDGQLDVDQDVRYSSDGAFVVLIDSTGSIIDGDLGHAFTDSVPFRDGEVRLIREEGEHYYIYDKAIPDQGQKAAGDGEVGADLTQYWLRGVTSGEFSEMAPSLDGTLRTVSTLFPVMILAILLAGWLVTRRALAPLRQITKTAEAIQKEGDLSRRIGIRAHGQRDEIRHTAEVFDGMLDQIERNFAREKQFTDNAGHELRTPVAVMMAECEYALDNLDDASELENSLHTILAESRHMSELISILLLFARADRGMYELNREWTDLSLLAEECCDRARKAAAERSIHLIVEAPEGIYADCDRILMGRALDNLISNGIKYGREEGFVRIKVETRGERVRIAVEDDGIGVPLEEKDKIWERFYRAENAKAYTDVSGEDESMGLGLSLVRWVGAAHGGRVLYEDRQSPREAGRAAQETGREMHEAGWETGSRFLIEIPLIGV